MKGFEGDPSLGKGGDEDPRKKEIPFACLEKRKGKRSSLLFCPIVKLKKGGCLEKEFV